MTLVSTVSAASSTTTPSAGLAVTATTVSRVPCDWPWTRIGPQATRSRVAVVAVDPSTSSTAAGGV
ncbi:hypothetical protein ACFQZC_21225 [Streptacidiphilus monticola]